MTENVKSNRFVLFFHNIILAHPMLFAVVVVLVMLTFSSCDKAKASEMIERYQDGAEESIEDFYTHASGSNVRFTLEDLTTVLETWIYPECGAGTIFYTAANQSDPTLVAYFYPQSGMGAPNVLLETDANEESGYKKVLRGYFPDASARVDGKFKGALVSKTPISTSILDQTNFFSYYVLFMNYRDYWLYKVNLYYDPNTTYGAYATSNDFYVYANPTTSVSGPGRYTLISHSPGSSGSTSFGSFVPNGNGKTAVTVSLGETYYNVWGLDGNAGTYYDTYYQYNDLIEDSYPEQLGDITAELTNDPPLSWIGDYPYILKGTVNHLPTNASSSDYMSAFIDYKFTFIGQNGETFEFSKNNFDGIIDKYGAGSVEHGFTSFTPTSDPTQYSFRILAEYFPQMTVTKIKFDAVMLLNDEVTTTEIHYDVDGFNLNFTEVGGYSLIDYTPVANKDTISDSEIAQLELLFQTGNNNYIDMNTYLPITTDFSTYFDDYPFDINYVHVTITEVNGVWYYGTYTTGPMEEFTLEQFLYDNAYVGYYDVVILDMYHLNQGTSAQHDLVGYLVYYTELFQVKYSNYYNSTLLQNIVVDAYYTKATYTYFTTVLTDFEKDTLSGINNLIGLDTSMQSVLDKIYNALMNIIDILEELSAKIPDFDPTELYDKLDDILEALTSTDDTFNEDDTVAEAITYYLNNLENALDGSTMPTTDVFTENKMSIWAAGKVHDWLEGTKPDSPSYFTLTIFSSITDAWHHLSNYSDLQDTVFTVLTGFSTSLQDASTHTTYTRDYVRMYESDFDITLRNQLEVVE